jgi:hypothetical protein
VSVAPLAPELVQRYGRLGIPVRTVEAI